MADVTVPDGPPGDWIGLAEAATLVRSPRPGKKTHLSTLYRWIAEGKLPCWRRGRWRFVRRADLLALACPVPCTQSPARSPAEERALQEQLQRRERVERRLGIGQHECDPGWARRVLDEAGI